MRVDSKNVEECCGCTACESICPHDAIRMKADVLGFLYPQIDETKCVDCSLCMKVCQFHEGYSRENRWATPEVRAARLRDKQELSRSQSGGAFYGLARKFLEDGGVVYGAGFVDHFRVVHKRVTTLAALEELRGSKYVQSDLRGIFPQVKADLREGRKVLFSGTPCQVSGLQSYVGKRWTDGLYTVDLVCHGVPSPVVWTDYVNYIEGKTGEACTKVKFRDKSFGWATHIETFEFKRHEKLTSCSWRIMFYKHLMLRYSCHACPYTNMNRCSDITVGDFWGWPKLSNAFNDNKGVSLVIVNSDKGKRLLELVADQFFFVQSNPTDCLQPQLQYPAKRNPHREAFARDYAQHGFLYVAKRYGDMGWRYKVTKVKEKVRRMAGVLLRRLKLRK